EEEEDARQEDRDRFEEAVLELSERLFDDRRHEPFHILRDQFNVWAHYAPSRHRGLTPGPQLTMRGMATEDDDELKTRYIPEPVLPLDKKKPGYSLKDLLRLVGLPRQDEPGSVAGDVAARVAELRAIWSQAGSLPAFMGYDDGMATPKVVEAWTNLRSRGIPLAVDTLYGLMQGSRWGDRESTSDERADMRSQPGPAASDETRAAFARRLHRWFDPERAVRSVNLDPRRYAPEYHRAGWNLFARLVSRLVDRRDPPDPDRRLGRVWDPDTPVESSTDERRRSSAGLVCLLVNASRSGATAHHRYAVCLTLGGRTHFPHASGPMSGRVRRLDHGADADYAVDHRKRTDSLAHELGHSFYGFGDEYESERGAAAVSVEVRDNLTHADTVREEGTIESDALPTPIDPERIKWAFLHRIEKADTVVRPTEIGASAGPGRSSRIIVTLAPGRAETWRKALEDDALVYLRRLKELADGRRRQLPILDDDLYEELTIEAIPDDHTVHLFGDEPLDPQSFPAGSVLYIPKEDAASGMPLTLVHEKVIEHMRTSGLPLTENHFAPGDDDADDGKNSDPVQKSRDVPPRIAAFASPCQEHKVLGLYEGGFTFTRQVYRPAGACKMRQHFAKDSQGEFCFVCKYLQVNLVDPGRHPELDKLYPRPSWLKKFLKGDG
ncbi:MAG TPA: M64 family metallopeptidase, partial [Kofleriaceae bacterium]|nr:M64 family metallopeptidase [Kofleriaceae bacterium]